MKIKNELINTKEYKKKIKLNKKMKYKAKKYENININDCSPLEQSLFGPHTFKDETTKNSKNKFIKLNKTITLLYLFPKSESDSLCNKFRKMFYENPMDKNIFSTIIDNKFTEVFKSYDNFHNSSSYGHIGHIEPKSILEYVSFINILVFNFSSNYFGIAFECKLNDEILKQFNNNIICDIKDYSEYREYYIGSKKHIGRYDWNPDIIRNNNFNNHMIEIKCLINNFINSYLKFEKKTIYVPISLNIYETNYEISDRPPSIMLSHYMYGYTNKHKFEQFSVWEHIPNKSDNYFKTDICFECYQNYENIDRNANIYVYTKSDKRNLFLVPESLIGIYITMLHFYKNMELEKLLANERNDIFSIYSKKHSKKIYKSYNKFLNRALQYKTLLTNIVSNNHYYTNEYLKKVSKIQIEKSKTLINDCESFEKYFEDKLSIENINETRKVSYISLFIAIISVLVAIIPIIYNDSEEGKIIDKISENNSYMNETNIKIKEINEQLSNIENFIIQNKKNDNH